MYKTLLLALTLICSVAFVQAQDPNTQNPPAGAGQSSSPSSGQTSVKGCLQGSDGNFTLTDQSGTTYQLQGDTSKLSEHVGHEVQIMGTTSDASASSGSSTSQGSSQPTLTVAKVKHLSKTCKSMSK